LPPSWKSDGLLQSRCIAHLSAPLGRTALGYGFRPVDGPSLKQRLRAWLERQRPAMLRGHAETLKGFLSIGARPALPPFGPLLQGNLTVASLLDLSRIRQPDQLTRAFTLEALLASPSRAAGVPCVGIVTEHSDNLQ